MLSIWDPKPLWDTLIFYFEIPLDTEVLIIITCIIINILVSQRGLGLQGTGLKKSRAPKQKYWRTCTMYFFNSFY